MPNLRKAAVLLGAALVVSVSACQKYEANKGGSTAAMTDSGAVTDAIKADEKAWNEDFKAKNLDKLLGHYAADATAVFPGAAAVSGGDGVRKTYEEALKDPAFGVSFSSDKIDTSGDLAYSRGHFQATQTDPKTKQAVAASGSYITVYKKQADGSWKVVEDFTAIEPAAAPAAAPAQ